MQTIHRDHGGGERKHVLLSISLDDRPGMTLFREEEHVGRRIDRRREGLTTALSRAYVFDTGHDHMGNKHSPPRLFINVVDANVPDLYGFRKQLANHDRLQEKLIKI